MNEDNFGIGYALGRDTTGNNGFGFGGGWEGLIGLALVAGLFGGWGGFGGGFGGNRGGYCGSACATQSDLANGFAQNTLQRGIDDIILGQATMQNFINQGFAGVNATVTNGFAGVNNAICTLGYQNAQLVNGLSREFADCCCATNRNIDALRFDNCKNTSEIIRAGQDNTRAILDYLTTEKISSLQAENSGLKAQISNDRQTRTIIDEIKPCPIPAYITCNPYQSAYGFGFNNNGNCGCGL